MRKVKKYKDLHKTKKRIRRRSKTRMKLRENENCNVNSTEEMEKHIQELIDERSKRKERIEFMNKDYNEVRKFSFDYPNPWDWATTISISSSEKDGRNLKAILNKLYEENYSFDQAINQIDAMDKYLIIATKSL